MLGFAIVDRQPAANATAVWLTSRMENSHDRRKDDSDKLKAVQCNHTNVVVISHTDERHDDKIRSLTADRAVVLTDGTAPPPPFVNPLSVAVFDGLIEATLTHQRRIAEAVAAARCANRKLVDPDFPGTMPRLTLGEREGPAYRALSVANYIARVWETWLATDAQRVRRTVNAKTGKPPGIMPDELGATKTTELPPEFADLATPEPVS